MTSKCVRWCCSW